MSAITFLVAEIWLVKNEVNHRSAKFKIAKKCYKWTILTGLYLWARECPCHQTLAVWSTRPVTNLKKYEHENVSCCGDMTCQKCAKACCLAKSSLFKKLLELKTLEAHKKFWPGILFKLIVFSLMIDLTLSLNLQSWRVQVCVLPVTEIQIWQSRCTSRFFISCPEWWFCSVLTSHISATRNAISVIFFQVGLVDSTAHCHSLVGGALCGAKIQVCQNRKLPKSCLKSWFSLICLNLSSLAA